MGVMVLTGPAGSGKTKALIALAESYMEVGTRYWLGYYLTLPPSATFFNNTKVLVDEVPADKVVELQEALNVRGIDAILAVTT